MSQDQARHQRRFLRFEPDEPEIAMLQFTEARPDDFFFSVEAAGLVIEEAYGGCALVCLRRELPLNLDTGLTCQIKVAKMSPLRAVIRWIRALDEDVCRVGLEYIDAEPPGPDSR